MSHIAPAVLAACLRGLQALVSFEHFPHRGCRISMQRKLSLSIVIGCVLMSSLAFADRDRRDHRDGRGRGPRVERRDNDHRNDRADRRDHRDRRDRNDRGDRRRGRDRDRGRVIVRNDNRSSTRVIVRDHRWGDRRGDHRWNEHDHDRWNRNRYSRWEGRRGRHWVYRRVPVVHHVRWTSPYLVYQPDYIDSSSITAANTCASLFYDGDKQEVCRESLDNASYDEIYNAQACADFVNGDDERLSCVVSVTTARQDPGPVLSYCGNEYDTSSERLSCMHEYL